jgi:hypothetical protein
MITLALRFIQLNNDIVIDSKKFKLKDRN